MYSDADADAAHVRLADAAVRLGPPPPAESYLRIDTVVRAAVETGSDAIHPGYGFLAERAAFARAVEDAGIVFVGPASGTIEALGDKLNARRLASRVGEPSVPAAVSGARGPPRPAREIEATAHRIGIPCGQRSRRRCRGMRGWRTPRTSPPALSGSREAATAFGDGPSTSSARSCPHATSRCSLGDAFGNRRRAGRALRPLQRVTRSCRGGAAPGLTRDIGTTPRAGGPPGGRRTCAARDLRVPNDPDGNFWFLESTRCSRWSTA